mmetsp:Transcript_11840/g.33841  ORF Transcript_11840/g.33841 Transcript_11840/m.33841 type:complete len:685 (+) Transcript_11840:110-2164(+)
MTKPPSVCVIGAGPGGMFFLHALASRRRKLEKDAANKKQDGQENSAAARVECEAKLAALPVVDCYEKSSSPGGVWRSASSTLSEFLLGDNDGEHDDDDNEPASPDTSLCSNESDEENHNQVNAISNNSNNVVRSSGILGDVGVEPPTKAKKAKVPNKPSSSTPSSTAAAGGAGDGSPSTQMYEALWINGNKEVQEFFDYTFDDHFQRPMPVYLPRAHVLEYVMNRVTQKANIFDDVLFNTAVISVDYHPERKEFDVVTRNEITGVTSSKTYDKCIWSGGLNATARMPRDVVALLSNQSFQGRVIHSTEMKDFEATIRGKKVLFIGDSYSAEDLALQSLKLGAEQIYITSRGGYGTASYVNAWPEDRVKVLWYMLPTGVTADGRGIVLSKMEWNYTTERYEPKEGGETVELEDISTVVLCTGYSPNMDCLSDELKASWAQKESKRVWSVPEGWKMKPNTMTDEVGDVTPSAELTGGEYYVKRGLYRHALIDNPNMMFLYESTSYPLLEIDVAAWLCLAYVCGDAELPTADEMEKRNLQQSLDEMSVPYLRYYKDKNYYAALNNLPKDHWWSKYTSSESKNYNKEYIRYQIQILARDMQSAGYRAGFGSYEKLSERGELMVDMTCEDSQGRYRLKSGEPDSSWRTFRDCDPSPFKSIFTGTVSVPLKGKWMDLDNHGEVLAAESAT